MASTAVARRIFPAQMMTVIGECRQNCTSLDLAPSNLLYKKQREPTVSASELEISISSDVLTYAHPASSHW